MAPKVLSQINKSKISRVLQELSDLRRDYRIAGIETNEDSQTVDELSDLLESDYSTLEAAELPENSELYAVRTNEGGWLFYEDELYANLPNGAYTGDSNYEIWNLENSEAIVLDNIDPGNIDSIDTGDGNDTIVVNVDVERGVTLDTGKGNDSITIGDSFRAKSSIDTGEGNDTVTVGNVGQGWNGGGVDLGSEMIHLQ